MKVSFSPSTLTLLAKSDLGDKISEEQCGEREVRNYSNDVGLAFRT